MLREDPAGRPSAVFDGTPLEGARITGRLAGVVDTYGSLVADAYRENEEFYSAARAEVAAAWDQRAQAITAREESAGRLRALVEDPAIPATPEPAAEPGDPDSTADPDRAEEPEEPLEPVEPVEPDRDRAGQRPALQRRHGADHPHRGGASRRRPRPQRG